MEFLHTLNTDVLYSTANDTHTHTHTHTHTLTHLNFIFCDGEYPWQAYRVYYFHMQYIVMLITPVCLIKQLNEHSIRVVKWTDCMAIVFLLEYYMVVASYMVLFVESVSCSLLDDFACGKRVLFECVCPGIL